MEIGRDRVGLKGGAGPAEYLPLHSFERQIKVNLIGYIATTQAFLPLIKASADKDTRRGRLMYVGTGGGVPATSPALISAYMASKWGGEAFQQSVRLEMQLRKLPIDVVMINPGKI